MVTPALVAGVHASGGSFRPRGENAATATANRRGRDEYAPVSRDAPVAAPHAHEIFCKG
jgi:hypothetical protein